MSPSHKRPAEHWPVWCAKSRKEWQVHGISNCLGIDELQAEEIVTGSSGSGGGEQAEEIALAFRAASGLCSKRMIDRFVQQADDAAVAAEVAKATKVAKANGTEVANGQWTMALLRAASASCKAQMAALNASEAVKGSLEKQAAALSAAESAHQRFRRARDRCQEQASATQSFAVRFKDDVPIQFANGLCAFEDAPLIGDIDRFFVHIISKSGSWSCGYVTCLDVNERDTIAAVKAKLQVKEGIPPEKIRLIWKGQKLRNEEMLIDYGILDNGQDWLIFGVLIPETLPTPTSDSDGSLTLAVVEETNQNNTSGIIVAK